MRLIPASLSVVLFILLYLAAPGVDAKVSVTGLESEAKKKRPAHAVAFGRKMRIAGMENTRLV